jgi:hypothetical protein
MKVTKRQNQPLQNVKFSKEISGNKPEKVFGGGTGTVVNVVVNCSAGPRYWVRELVLGIETGRIAWAPKASFCTHTSSTIIVELTTQITIEAV